MKKLILAFFLIVVVGLFAQKLVFAQGQQSKFELDREHQHRSVCQSGENRFNCTAKVIVDGKGNPLVRQNSPTGYGPLQLLGAYNLSGISSTTKTLAIIDAYDNPNALSDLNFYSKYYSLPQLASCPVSGGTTSSPCFQKINQNGGITTPRRNMGWGLEIDLDLQVAHAVCQNCNILLVEANSASFGDLLTAVNRARLMGAKIISNSYGANEFASETTYDHYFNYPGIMYIFSSGDSGYGTSYPASSQYVTAVGGTTLNVNPDNSYQSETAWSGAGSGCSRFETKPLWQQDLSCSERTVADISADADPNTGAAIYDSYGYGGWLQVGGTSLAAPLVAGVYALADVVPTGTIGSALPYSLKNYATNLHDINSGNNGNCGGSYLCTAVSGYDGPTGLGTPNGTGAL
ncbi:MAG TPA: S53 family peptidase [Patescibacteria group bacterium]